jgi:hypothetical protein
MEYIQETIDSTLLKEIFNLPLSFQNKKVEVTIKPVENKNLPGKKSSYGCLHAFADPSKTEGEKGSWERAAIAKYAKN